MDKPRNHIHYTDLNVWKKADALSRRISELYVALGKCPELRNQLYRATLSVSSNIAEGEGQGTNRGALKFYYIARGSLYESRTQLKAAFSLGCISINQLIELEELADDVARLIAGVIRARRRREDQATRTPPC